MAVEWARRGVCIEATVVHVSVAGDQSSAGRTASAPLVPSTVVPPPVASTEPSGSSVRLWNARGKAIGAVARQAGEPCVMSRTYVVAAAGAEDTPPRAAVPDFMILPGAYMTALWPSTTFGSTRLQVCVPTVSVRVAVGWATEPAASTRPSGSTNIAG